MKQKTGQGNGAEESPTSEDYLIAFGRCSYGEFDGVVYGRDEYEALVARVKDFEMFAARRGLDGALRPWQFEVDPYRRHSVIAAVGVQVDGTRLRDVLSCLKDYLGLGAGDGQAHDPCPSPESSPPQ